MTCIAAINLKDRVVIASDSQVNAVQGGKTFPANFSKLIEFPNFIIGFSGEAIAWHVLQGYKASASIRKRRFKTSQEVYIFFRKFYLDLYKLIDKGIELTKEANELILITKDKIFLINESLVEECEIMATCGSGADIATGSLARVPDPELAVAEAIKRRSDCGGDIHTKELIR